MSLSTVNGFLTSGSTFADVVADAPSDTSWYRIWDTDNGQYYDDPNVNTVDGWVSASDLANMQLPNDTNNFYIQSWGPDSGASDWVDFSVAIGSQDNYYTFNTMQPADSAMGQVTYDAVIDTTNMSEDTWLQVWNADSGEYLDQGGDKWIQAKELGDYALDTGSDGTSTNVWVKSYLSGDGSSGWDKGTIEFGLDDDDGSPVQEEYSLTVDTDEIAGNSLNNTFVADVEQFEGGTSNTLASGDYIDGGEGEDTLDATLIPEYIGDDYLDFGQQVDTEGILTPDTESVEIAEFTVQQDTSGNFDSERLAGVDAGDMSGLQELWSVESRAHLAVEDVRSTPADTLIGMRDTDGSSDNVQATSNLDVKWNPEDLTVSEEAGEALFYIDVDDLGNAGTVEGIDDLQISFDLNGTNHNVDVDMDNVVTYAQLATAINSSFNAMAQDPANPDVDPGDIQVVNTNTNVFIPQAYPAGDGVRYTIKDFKGRTFSDEQVKQASSSADSTGAWLEADPEKVRTEEIIKTNIVVDGVGGTETTYGESNTTDGGTLDIGSMGTAGIQRFQVDVGDDSNVASFASMNRSQSDGIPMNERLEEVWIEDLNNEGDAEYGSYLQIGNSHSELGQLNQSNLDTGLWNVREVDATDYMCRCNKNSNKTWKRG